jgi:pilus assembly protein CpaF
MEENVITMQEIFSFEKRGIGMDGRVLGAFKPSRIRPRFVERLKTAGIMLPPDTFDKSLEVN